LQSSVILILRIDSSIQKNFNISCAILFRNTELTISAPFTVRFSKGGQVRLTNNGL